MFYQVVSCCLAAFTGAAMQELLHWRDRHQRFTAAEYAANRRGYWLLTVLMILGSTAGTWFWFDDVAEPKKNFLLMGAAFPLIFKKAILAFESKEVRFGPTEKPSVLRTYVG